MTFNYIKKTLFAFCVIVFSMLSVKAVYASEAKISISTESVEEAKNVTVTVTVTSDGNIGVGDLWLTYDASVISYFSGADSTGDTGSIRLIVEGDGTVKEVKREIVFVGKKAGNTEVKVSDGCELYDFDTEELMTVSATSGKVTVTAPVVASSDNTLKKLVVYGVDKNGDSHKLSLSPSFSKSKTEYALEVGADITKLSVTATPNDSKATVKVSGLKLSDGDNVTTIKVTAENGDSKSYYIYTEKEKSKEEETTTAGDKQDETTAPPVDNTEYIELAIGDAIKYMPVKIGEVALPEGFEVYEYTYDGKTVEAAKGLSKDILIFYILDENKENGKFYIYDETANSFSLMINIQTGGKLYTIVAAPSDLVVPEGFVATTINIDGADTAAWSYGEVSDFAYVYAMNWDGQCAIYSYDTVEKTMQRVSEYAGAADLVTKVEGLEAEIESNRATIETQKATIENLTKFRKIVIIVAIIIFVVLLGMLIWNIIVKVAEKSEKDEEAATDETAENGVDTASVAAIMSEETDETQDVSEETEITENTLEESENSADVEANPEAEETAIEKANVEAVVVETEVSDAEPDTEITEKVEETVETTEEAYEMPEENAVEENYENVIISPEDSVEKEKMVPVTEVEPGFKYEVEETVDKDRMVPDDSEFKEKEEFGTESLEEGAIISRLADEEIENLTLEMQPLDMETTEAIIDSLLNFEIDED